jgi:hypothetical protein
MPQSKSEKKSGNRIRREFMAVPESAQAIRVKQGLFQIVRAGKAHHSAKALAGAHVEVVIRGKGDIRMAPAIIRLDLGDIDLDQIEIGDADEASHAEPSIGNRTIERALADARTRGHQLAAQILSSEDMLSADAFASRLGVTRTSINTWRKSGRVLALSGARRGFRYPAWQISPEGRPFDALQGLFSTLGGSAWAVYRFLIQHHSELEGRTGLEALERGQDDKALGAAESVARAIA